ncbi:MAG: tRNA (adenosine(37)-N6)-threonylcarbamoyltransferase complex ATPase subunit type 1 TsaE [Erysipelotrichia bacterium]|nr:tRNA (adenosine(37)-N6)-threonylcarbamoyltransferase complex ATPase subunit type 1 TsaE [Erysipelotrichia bacterium]
MGIEIVTHQPSETVSLGYKIATHARAGSVFCLTGDLGAGKTTLVRGMAKALNIKTVVQSPTFNIMKIYFDGRRPLIHIDAYRLEGVSSDIGLDEYIGYESGLTVVEWPEFVAGLLPNNATTIEIINLGDDNRQITITSEDKDYLESLNKWLQY